MKLQMREHLYFFIVQKMQCKVLLTTTMTNYLMHWKIGKMKLMKMVGMK